MINDNVLLEYARALQQAQFVEGRLKILLALYREVFAEEAKAIDQMLRPMMAKGTMGQALTSVLQEMDRRGAAPIPDNARKCTNGPRSCARTRCP